MKTAKTVKNMTNMKTSTRAFLFATAWSSTTALAQAPAPEASRVERVVVFADRAEVTRVATARCTGGAAAAVFAGLPTSIDPRTLRGEADGGAVFVGVSTKSTALVEALDERVKSTQTEAQTVDDEIAALQRAQEDDDNRLASIQSYGLYFRTLIAEELRAPKPEVAKWEQLLQTLQIETVSANARAVARNAEVRVLERRRERLANRLALLNPAQAPANVEATVAVRCGSSAQPSVRLSYVVPGAMWSPEYDLRFTGPADQNGGKKTGDGRAVLTVAGVVTQSSGEDWVDAEIWLSTAKPRLGGEAPLPNPIYVNGFPEEKGKTLVQAQEHRAEDLKSGQATSGGANGAELEDGGKAFVLKLPKKVTVRADGRPYWFPVDDVSAPARSSLVALPQLTPWVFQTASLSNPAAYPLMAGKVHVFRGPTFVGDDWLEYRGPGEPFEVSLGIDEEVELERKDLLQQKREAGFFSGSQTIAHAWRTILHNRSNQDVVVEIREQVPVSKSADIKVDIATDPPSGKKPTTSAGFTLDKVRGHLKWQVPLKRGETAQRDVAFEIGLPKEWAVQ